MTDLLARSLNLVVAGTFLAVCGGAVALEAPRLWEACSNPVPALAVAFGFVSLIVVGWFAMESRKY